MVAITTMWTVINRIFCGETQGLELQIPADVPRAVVENETMWKTKDKDFFTDTIFNPIWMDEEKRRRLSEQTKALMDSAPTRMAVATDEPPVLGPPEFSSSQSGYDPRTLKSLFQREDKAQGLHALRNFPSGSRTDSQSYATTVDPTTQLQEFVDRYEEVRKRFIKSSLQPQPPSPMMRPQEAHGLIFAPKPRRHIDIPRLYDSDSDTESESSDDVNEHVLASHARLTHKTYQVIGQHVDEECIFCGDGFEADDEELTADKLHPERRRYYQTAGFTLSGATDETQSSFDHATQTDTCLGFPLVDERNRGTLSSIDLFRNGNEEMWRKSGFGWCR